MHVNHEYWSFFSTQTRSARREMADSMPVMAVLSHLYLVSTA